MTTGSLAWQEDPSASQSEGDASASPAGPTALAATLSASGPVRMWIDVELASHAPSAISLSVGANCRLEVSGDADDDALVHATAYGETTDDPRGTVEYRLRPDTTPWAHDDEERRAFDREFAEIPGWRGRRVRLAIDLTSNGVRTWLDGRLVAVWNAPESTPGRVRVALGAGDRLCDSGVIDLPEDRFLAVDVAPYSSCDAAGAEDSHEPPGRAAAVVAANGVPFLLDRAAGEGCCLDVGRTLYRGRTPYIHTSALSSDPGRCLLRVPVDAYDRAHLLCTVNTDPSHHPSGAVRLIKTGRGHAVSSEFEVDAHGAEAIPGSGMTAVTVDLSPGAFQDFIADPSEEALEIDLTRRIAFDDDDRFPHPAGPPSGVRVHAITLETAPVAMTLTSDRTAHVFEQPAQPTFVARLRNCRGEAQRVRLSTSVTDPYGEISVREMDVDMAANAKRAVTIDLPQTVCGKFDLSVVASVAEDDRPFARKTSFALLPPDTRRATTDSPFGMWCYFEGHFGAPAEVGGELFRLLGVRWTLANFVASDDKKLNDERMQALAKHKVGLTCANVACIANTCNDGQADVDDMMRKMHDMPPVKHWLVFWETSLSREHASAFMPDLVGNAPRPLTPEEDATFRICWNVAVEYATRVRAEFPEVKLVYGNGFPPFIAELLRHGFPKELIDGFGLDFDMFLATPELQPGPLYAPFAGLHVLRAFQDAYGYEDFPRYLTEAIYCSQADGWLTEREQADCYVRAHLLAMASGVVHFGMTAEPWDPGSDFFYSHYGPVGLCHKPPELNPRESFPAYATMTRSLDGATFDTIVPTASASVFLLRFERAGGSPVYAAWTLHGERDLTFEAATDAAKRAAVTDMFGNAGALKASGGRDGRYRVRLTSSPVYVDGEIDVRDIDLGEPQHRAGPPAEALLADGHELSEWCADAGADLWLETPARLHSTAPYTRGEFERTPETGAAHGPTMRVRLAGAGQGHAYNVYYAITRPAQPVPIPEGQFALGAWICGSSTWGRVVYEVADSNGLRWRSIYDDSFVDFDGWRYVETELPLPADCGNVQESGMRAWKSVDGAEGSPPPAVALTAIVLEARTHLVRAADLIAVADPSFTVSRIVAADEPAGPEPLQRPL